MHASDDANASSGSTTWSWQTRMIRTPAGGRGRAAARRASSPPLGRRNPREPLTIVVRYRGGPEAYYEVRARGRLYRRPGVVSIHDLMEDINDGVYGQPVEASGFAPKRKRKPPQGG